MHFINVKCIQNRQLSKYCVRFSVCLDWYQKGQFSTVIASNNWMTYPCSECNYKDSPWRHISNIKLATHFKTVLDNIFFLFTVTPNTIINGANILTKKCLLNKWKKKLSLKKKSCGDYDIGICRPPKMCVSFIFVCPVFAVCSI